LRGIERFRILTEDQTRPYRRAMVQSEPDGPLDDDQRRELGASCSRLMALLGSSYAEPPELTPDEAFVHRLAHSQDFEPLERQALLERANLCLRAQSLVELIEMRRLAALMPGAPNTLQ
jgi:Lon protease-like protein